MKVRVRFNKLGKIRWTSHRDVARMWERAFRRLSLPLAYTQGFSPRPKVSFGLAPSALAAQSLVVTRQRKGHDVTDDVRPAILSLDAGTTDTGNAVLRCELATQPRGLRPAELLGALSPELEEGLVRRLHQWIQRDGARWEPIPLPFDATDAPHVLMGRAS